MLDISYHFLFISFSFTCNKKLIFCKIVLLDSEYDTELHSLLFQVINIIQP